MFKSFAVMGWKFWMMVFIILFDDGIIEHWRILVLLQNSL